MYKPSIFLVLLIMINCSSRNPTVSNEVDIKFKIEVLKWFGGHQSAISITYDAAWGMHYSIPIVVDEVVKRGLRMDFEIVPKLYNNEDNYHFIEEMRSELIPKGVHFFGHGYSHDNHDSLSFEDAYNSFKVCFDLMAEWGLNPKVYAYPFSAGQKPSTQLANKLAGFLCARGGTYDQSKFFICAENEDEPENWYFLPSIPVDEKYNRSVQNHEEMANILDQALKKSSWVIIMYHCIGMENRFAYYPFSEFEKDLNQISGNDFWSGNMDMIACYIKERLNFKYEVSPLETNHEFWDYEVYFKDDLNNEIYNQPLTLQFQFSPNTVSDSLFIEPSVESKNIFKIYNGKTQLNIIPDENKYRIRLYKKHDITY